MVRHSTRLPGVVTPSLAKRTSTDSGRCAEADFTLYYCLVPGSLVHSATQPRAHMPQLDGVRGVAIAMVLVSHFGVFDSIPGLAIPGRFLGAVGVDLFFVLSGFLITGLLLDARQRIERSDRTVMDELRRFYARRALRIFPIYYGTLLTLALLGIPSVTEYLGWHVTYLANWRVAVAPFSLGPVAHFWSLAVEEQFYLFWPSLILLVPRRHLIQTVLFLVTIAVVTRAGLWYEGAHAFTIRFNTISCLDYLGIGSLLAILGGGTAHESDWIPRIARVGFWIGMPGTVAFLVRARTLDDVFYWGFAGIFVALASASWVVRAARGESGGWGRLLSSGPAKALGRVSYGLYVYHFPVLLWVDGWMSRPAEPSEVVARLLTLFAATGAIATASWWLIERPINGLKRHFAY